MTVLHAQLNHVVSEGTPGSFLHTFVKRLDNGKHLTVGPSLVPIADLRERLARGDRPQLDVEGYAVAEHVYEGLAEHKGWEEKYKADMAEWLRDYLGAKKVFCYSAAVRRRIPKDDPDYPQQHDEEKLQPALVCHVDLAQAASLVKCSNNLGLTPEQVKVEGLRIATINIWRPLSGPVMDCPLAVCDARALRSEDCTITHDIYGDGTFISAAPDRHRWAYCRDQMPHELLLFRCYDSTRGYDEGGCTPHSAFIDEARSGPGFAKRESVELRCSVLY